MSKKEDYPTFIGDEVEKFNPRKPISDQIFGHVIDEKKRDEFVQNVNKWAEDVKNKILSLNKILLEIEILLKK